MTWQLLAQGFSDPTSVERIENLICSPWTWCPAIAIGLALAYCYCLRRQRLKGGSPTDDPQILFRELCRVHGLRRRAIRCLEKLAKEHSLEIVALVFARPELFSAREIPPKLASQANLIEDLRRKLFATRS